MRSTGFGSLFLTLAALVSCTGADPGAAEPTLEEVLAATEKYQDVNVALAAGYVRDWLDACETPYHMGITEPLGTMGIHFLRLDLLGIDDQGTRLDVTGTHTDFREPAVLVYEPQADGSLELVALENLISAAAWAAAGNADSPTFQGIPWEYRAADPSMMVEAHYDRHVWVRENPSGVFAQYNPEVSCEHHEYNMPMIHPGDSHSAH